MNMMSFIRGARKASTTFRKKVFFNKYAPHQGKHERARRRSQIASGFLKAENGLV